jgi:hypothetical protein
MLLREIFIVRITRTYKCTLWQNAEFINVAGRAVESESEGILDGVGVGKKVPTQTPTSI